MRKMFKALEIFIYALLLLITVASAANAAWTMPSSTTLGDDSQERDEFTQLSLSITNSDNSTSITNIQASFSETSTKYDATDFNITFDIPSSIDPSTTGTLTVHSFVPLNKNSKREKIGAITLTADQGNNSLSKTVELFMEAESKLRIDQVDITIDGDQDEDIDENDDPEAKRKDDVEFIVTVENRYNDNDNEFEIDTEVTIQSDAFEDERDSDSSDIEGDDSYDFDDFQTFEVDDKAKDRKYDVTITAEGTDGFGAEHFDEFKFDLDVKVEDREITIREINVFPAPVCAGESFRVDIDFENTGTRDLNDAVLYIEFDDLAITKKISNIDIRDGKDKTESVTLLIPKDTDEGTYFMDVTAFYKDSSSADTDRESELITIRDCDDMPKEAIVQEDDTSFDIVTPTAPAATGMVFGVSAVRKASFFDSSAYLTLLVFAILVVLVLIVLLLTQGRKDELY
ncbi:hypothetical protein GOV08_01985 [Candidatus Woesearchaeota archaeon]|nr:hypothetical protein [Candidatus Woesearchaeota archaeon]